MGVLTAELAGGAEWWCPDDAVAGVVLVGGSGPADRTDEGYFTAYRREFLAAGLAVCWYDKRSPWTSSSLGDLASDAAAVLTTVRSALPPGLPVGFFGHSEGGWVATLAAARDVPDDVAFVVANSCPGVPPGIQDRHAVAVAAAAGGRAPDDVLAAFDVLLDEAGRDGSFAGVTRRLAALPGGDRLRGLLGDELAPDVWEFWKRKHDHDPIAPFARLRCPYLGVFGGADALVPVGESLAAFGAAAADPARAATARVTLHLRPGADHRLRVPPEVEPGAGHLRFLAGWITGAVLP